MSDVEEIDPREEEKEPASSGMQINTFNTYNINFGNMHAE